MKMRPFDNIITCSQPRIYIRFLRALLLKSIDHRATIVCTHIARDRRHWMDGDETSTESDRTILIASHSAQCTLEHIHTDIQRMAAFINIFLFALRFLRVCVSVLRTFLLFSVVLKCSDLLICSVVAWHNFFFVDLPTVRCRWLDWLAPTHRTGDARKTPRTEIVSSPGSYFSACAAERVSVCVCDKNVN